MASGTNCVGLTETLNRDNFRNPLAPAIDLSLRNTERSFNHTAKSKSIFSVDFLSFQCVSKSGQGAFSDLVEAAPRFTTDRVSTAEGSSASSPSSELPEGMVSGPPVSHSSSPKQIGIRSSMGAGVSYEGERKKRELELHNNSDNGQFKELLGETHRLTTVVRNSSHETTNLTEYLPEPSPIELMNRNQALEAPASPVHQKKGSLGQSPSGQARNHNADVPSQFEVEMCECDSTEVSAVIEREDSLVLREISIDWKVTKADSGALSENSLSKMETGFDPFASPAPPKPKGSVQLPVEVLERIAASVAEAKKKRRSSVNAQKIVVPNEASEIGRNLSAPESNETDSEPRTSSCLNPLVEEVKKTAENRSAVGNENRAGGMISRGIERTCEASHHQMNLCAVANTQRLPLSLQEKYVSPGAIEAPSSVTDETPVLLAEGRDTTPRTSREATENLIEEPSTRLVSPSGLVPVQSAAWLPGIVDSQPTENFLDDRQFETGSVPPLKNERVSVYDTSKLDVPQGRIFIPSHVSESIADHEHSSIPSKITAGRNVSDSFGFLPSQNHVIVGSDTHAPKYPREQTAEVLPESSPVYSGFKSGFRATSAMPSDRSANVSTGLNVASCGANGVLECPVSSAKNVGVPTTTSGASRRGGAGSHRTRSKRGGTIPAPTILGSTACAPQEATILDTRAKEKKKKSPSKDGCFSPKPAKKEAVLEKSQFDGASAKKGKKIKTAGEEYRLSSPYVSPVDATQSTMSHPSKQAPDGPQIYDQSRTAMNTGCFKVSNCARSFSAVQKNAQLGVAVTDHSPILVCESTFENNTFRPPIMSSGIVTHTSIQSFAATESSSRLLSRSEQGVVPQSRTIYDKQQSGPCIPVRTSQVLQEFATYDNWMNNKNITADRFCTSSGTLPNPSFRGTEIVSSACLTSDSIHREFCDGFMTNRDNSGRTHRLSPSAPSWNQVSTVRTRQHFQPVLHPVPSSPLASVTLTVQARSPTESQVIMSVGLAGGSVSQLGSDADSACFSQGSGPSVSIARASPSVPGYYYQRQLISPGVPSRVYSGDSGFLLPHLASVSTTASPGSASSHFGFRQPLCGPLSSPTTLAPSSTSPMFYQMPVFKVAQIQGLSSLNSPTMSNEL